MTDTQRVRGRIPASELIERERALLDTARTLFLESGFDGVSVESLARAARVSPKTIYGHFGGKEGLFVAAMKPQRDAIVAPLAETPRELRDVERVLARFGEKLLDVTLSPNAVRMQRRMIGEAERFPKLARLFYTNGPEAGLSALADFFDRCRRAKLFSCPTPRDTAEQFIGALQGEWLRVALYFDRRPAPAERASRARNVARATVDALLAATPRRAEKDTKTS